MRILLCLNREFMSNLALNRLLPALDGHEFDIVLSRQVGRSSAPKARAIEEWQGFEKALTEEQLFPLIEQRGIDRPWFQSFAQLAQGSVSGRLHEFAAINRDDGLRFVRDFQPDLIVSIRFGQIFKPPLTGIPRFGILNLHSGILPDYRGILATFWAMLHGETDIGCTLHYVVDPGIDTGPIISIHRKPFMRERSLLWHVASLYDGGTAMLADALAALSCGHRTEGTPQPPGAGRYFSYPGDDVLRQFFSRGYRLYTNEDYAELFDAYGVKLKAGSPLRFTLM